jgi:uncharacterized protein (TIGR01777 family)
VAIWDGVSFGDWASELEGAKAVVNLSGEPISQKWSDRNKQEILDSRTDSTRAIGMAAARCESPPEVWLNASGIDAYGDGRDAIYTESSPFGMGFPAQVCKAWEGAAVELDPPGTRLVLMRTAVVFGRNAAALMLLRKVVKWFAGGSVGDGRQFISWIHIEDLVRAYEFCMDEGLAGPVNATAPEPVHNGELMSELRRQLGRPWSPPTPAWAVRALGALGGPPPDLALQSIRAVPEALLSHGFSFQFPDLRSAIAASIG